MKWNHFSSRRGEGETEFFRGRNCRTGYYEERNWNKMVKGDSGGKTEGNTEREEERRNK